MRDIWTDTETLTDERVYRQGGSDRDIYSDKGRDSAKDSQRKRQTDRQTNRQKMSMQRQIRRTRVRRGETWKEDTTFCSIVITVLFVTIYDISVKQIKCQQFELDNKPQGGKEEKLDLICTILLQICESILVTFLIF